MTNSNIRKRFAYGAAPSGTKFQRSLVSFNFFCVFYLRYLFYLQRLSVHAYKSGTRVLCL